MPGFAKELKDDTKNIEKDEVFTELDNAIDEGSETSDNEVESEKEPLKEVKDEIEEDNKEDDDKEEEAPDLKMEKDKLVSSDGGPSVDLNEELADVGTGSMTEMNVTDEEKQAAAENPAALDLFDMETGASSFSGESVKDAAHMNESESTQSSPADNILEENKETGATKPMGKAKKFLFSAISGLNKAKKSVTKFFTKKLPANFKTGAAQTRKILEKTPLKAIFTWYDKKQEEKEKSRPERERKSREKKEKWLMDRDEKKRKKLEEQRLKERMDELEAKWKEAHAKYEKENNTLGYRTGKFFKGIWGGIKTGASWIAKKIKDQATANAKAFMKDVGTPLANSKVGVATKKMAVKTIAGVKKIVNDAKLIATTVMTTVSNKIDQMKDEYDGFTFEERMEKITREENQKKESGEDVPKDDYRTRYLALTEELKGKLSSIRGNVDRRKEIEATLAELEENRVLALPGKEVIGHHDWQEIGSTTAKADTAESVFEKFGKLESQFDEKTQLPAIGVIKIISNLGKLGANAAKMNIHDKRRELMDAILSTSQDKLIQRVAKYARTNSEEKELEAGFNVAQNFFDMGTGVGEATGLAPLAGTFKFCSKTISVLKTIVMSSKKRSGVKEGLKDMLGGREGYYALKAKYKMHAPEMRRAIRDALGVATSEDAVTADKWELSHLMSERTKSGVIDRETQRMVDEAGGTTEKHFDALQGAGSTVKRRFADRRKRMTA